MQKLLEKINLKSALLIVSLALTASWSNAQQKHPAEPEMVFVQGGTFMMGCSGEGCGCGDNMRPVHQVTVSSFNISKYEITQEQWLALMPFTSSREKGDKLPVNNVSWNEIQMFIDKLNAKTGKQYRLPTEAEWEYAARGGNKSKGYKNYSGSNNLNDVAWYKENTKKAEHVGIKQPNELGIYDLSGNVWEFCGDLAGPYSNSPKHNPQGDPTGSNRIIRGGGYMNDASECCVGNRDWESQSFRDFQVGFRLVLP